MDQNLELLFGVLALQADLLSNDQFAEACSAWVTRKHTPLADLLVERGWLTPADRAIVQQLVERKLKKHGGDVQASLAEAAGPAVQQSLAGVADPGLKASLRTLTPSAAVNPAEAVTLKPAPADGQVLPTTTDYQPAKRERYSLTRLHAKGGIGQVWLARDEDLGREVALKELQPEQAANPAVVARFVEEARIAAQLQHPGIIPVHELSPGSAARTPFYTMKFIRGRTLADGCQRYHQRRQAGTAGPLELRELLGAFVTVCQAVAYAHSRNVIHRDLKTANVALGDYGEVLVLDFGLSKVVPTGASEHSPPAPASLLPVTLPKDACRGQTLQGQTLGTPGYMPPEQAGGQLDRIDARSDIYSLGAILYEILTGVPPFAGADVMDILLQVLNEPPRPPRQRVSTVPAALEAICLKTLAKEPGARYASATVLAAEVERFLADEPVQAYPEPWTTRVRRWLDRHRIAVSAAAAALVVATIGLAVGAGLLASARDRERSARSDADQQRDAANQIAYVAGMGLAQRAWEENNVVRARELLNEVPKEAAGRDLRGFEWYSLSRLCHSETLTIDSDLGPVWSVAFSPDGLRLAAGSSVGKVKIFESATGKELVSLRGTDASRISSVAFSRDGRYLAAGGGLQVGPPGLGQADQFVKIWDSATGEERWSLKVKGSWVWEVAFSPDGKRLAMRDTASKVTILEIATRKEKIYLDRRGGGLTSMAFSPDGRYLAAGGWLQVPGRTDGKVILWDSLTGEEQRFFVSQDCLVERVTFSPDGRHLATAEGFAGLDIRAGECKLSI
jgi:serine/threonine protein kinase